ncbi:hypothetical protein SDC9_201603 [bioreactor metagenome]|uniref:Uncharacterized protein n=1 Tax=bioreactor metagenome TaxID=1076179 RepID=A0A645J0A6_9ZZZZ
MVVRIHQVGGTDLFQFVDAIRSPGAFAGGGQRRQQHCGQNRDDRDYHQEFYQGEFLFLQHDSVILLLRGLCIASGWRPSGRHSPPAGDILVWAGDSPCRSARSGCAG